MSNPLRALGALLFMLWGLVAMFGPLALLVVMTFYAPFDAWTKVIIWAFFFLQKH